MKHYSVALLLCLLFCLAIPAPLEAPAPDPLLAAEIAKIKAVDNHAHPLRCVSEGESTADEYDALALEEIEPFPNPVRIRQGKLLPNPRDSLRDEKSLRPA